ncbi:uncharacterized protein LOC122304705 [Carya illinoinensis]|uniref:uncharacterized protein LOC122304705 n=1 Tax=Carya illinoinensis TaxID=32201 RepID=UPI001C724510|nr:uncharacterized protein LOC122304705 [Carya illinoinensis]
MEGGWGVIGGFNEVLYKKEKVGGNPRTERLMGMFRHMMEEGNLYYLGWTGNKFTWCNLHEDETFTKERLNRAIANAMWKRKYSKYSVETLPAFRFDHNIILLQCSIGRCSVCSFHSSFKYEASWNNEEGCSAIVSEAWQNNTKGRERGLEKVMSKLKSTQKGLKKWSRNLERERTKAIREKT